MEQELMDILTDLRPDVDFETETALIDDHILESFDIVSLVAALNDAFDIEIGAKDLVPENFNSSQESAGHGAAPAGRGLMDRTALKTGGRKIRARRCICLSGWLSRRALKKCAPRSALTCSFATP